MKYEGQPLMPSVAAELRDCREAFLSAGGDEDRLHDLIREVKDELKPSPDDDHAYICNILWDIPVETPAMAKFIQAITDLISTLLYRSDHKYLNYSHYFAWIQSRHPELFQGAYPLPMGVTQWSATAAAKQSPQHAAAFIQGRRDWLDYIESLILWDKEIPEVEE